MENLKLGDLAYFDSFAGLVPCKVVSIEGLREGVQPACASVQVGFILTANRGAYKRGEMLKANSLHVVPRKSIRFGNRISPYTVG